MPDVPEVIRLLDLVPHPEGGHYRETFRDPRSTSDGRSLSTAIYYLLAAGEVSRWHRVDAAEIWHWHAGAALRLSTTLDGKTVEHRRLGQDLVAGERPQLVVPTGVWQSATSCGAWTLVGCTVAPGFQLEGFELAEAGFASLQSKQSQRRAP
ncbi:MAG: cupin domain-containing protein [Hyphomicrobiaceae bacterium]